MRTRKAPLQAAIPNYIYMLYTRKGDNGETDLADGSRVPKNHPRIECTGIMDEVCSYIGLAIAVVPEREKETLTAELHLMQQAQRRLFALGAWTAAAAAPKGMPGQTDVEALERAMDAINAETGRTFSGFVLPGGHPAAAHCHVARTLVRRLERTLLSAGAAHWPQAKTALTYVNRLSDFLYAVAKKINAVTNHEETPY